MVDDEEVVAGGVDGQDDGPQARDDDGKDDGAAAHDGSAASDDGENDDVVAEADAGVDPAMRHAQNYLKPQI